MDEWHERGHYYAIDALVAAQTREVVHRAERPDQVLKLELLELLHRLLQLVEDCTQLADLLVKQHKNGGTSEELQIFGREVERVIVEVVWFLTQQRLITALVLSFSQFEQVDRRENFLVAKLRKRSQGSHDRPNQRRLLKGPQSGQTAVHGNL